MLYLKRKSPWFAIFSMVLVALLAVPFTPLATSAVHAQDGGDGEDVPVSMTVSGEVQYVGTDFIVVDGFVVYANDIFDIATVNLGDTVTAEGELQEDGTLLATSYVLDAPAEEGEEGEEPEQGDTITIIGPVEFVDDEIMVGGYAIAPSGSFNPSSLEEGDLVVVTGVLLNETTVQASSLTLLVSGEEEDCEEGEEDCLPEEEDDDDGEEGEGCDREDHPVTERLVEEYSLDVSVITGWRCDGFGYGEITRAIRLAELSGDAADDILARRTAGEGWGKILKDYDVSPSELAPGKSQGKGNNGNGNSEDKGNNGKGNKGNKGNNGKGNGKGNSGD